MASKKARKTPAQLLEGRLIDKAYIAEDGTVELQLSDGTLVHVARDAEGNGPGALYVYEPNTSLTVLGGR